MQPLSDAHNRPTARIRGARDEEYLEEFVMG
jgi:hypothetical protein